MALSMKLVLIRHGETVDNVAGLYAGVRDSPLTNHGLLQTRRLADHFIQQGLHFDHIFSSDLQRARKTAQAIVEAQQRRSGVEVETNGTEEPVPMTHCESNLTAGRNAFEKHTSTSERQIVQVVEQTPLLREQDFGFYEGKSFYTRTSSGTANEKQESRTDSHRDEEGFVDVESKDSMAQRVREFLDEFLVPILQRYEQSAVGNVKSVSRLGEAANGLRGVAIVAHGIILGSLWRGILNMFGRGKVGIAPGVAIGGGRGPVTTLEHLGGWSNTGYLQVKLEYDPREVIPRRIGPTTGEDLLDEQTAVDIVVDTEEVAEIEDRLTNGEETTNPSTCTNKRSSDKKLVLSGWSMLIEVVNGKDHLKGVKRTGGGLGSSKYDEGQKTIESFFKRRKT